MKHPLFLDIETVPDWERLETVVPDLIDTKSNLELSVTPEFCRVVALGYAKGDNEIGCATVAEYSEKRLIERFWELAESNGPLVGYNIAGFDIPVLLIRSALLGVKPTRPPFDTRPWGTDLVDLMKARFPYGKAMKLRDLATYYNIPVLVSDVDGSDVVDMLENDPGKLKRYCISDVSLTRELYRFYAGYFVQDLNLQARQWNTEAEAIKNGLPPEVVKELSNGN